MKIVILEDNQERRTAMRAWLQDRFYTFETSFFDTAADTIKFLESNLGETIIICLDHDLEMKPGVGQWIDPGSGRDVADYLAGKLPVCPVVIQTTNSVGGAGMEAVLQEAGWSTIRVVPFDDLDWIDKEWFPTVRRAVVGGATRTVSKPS